MLRLSLLLLAALQAAAPPPIPAQFQTAYSIQGHPGSVSVPFELANNHIVVSAVIDGRGPFRLVVDTGMPLPGVLLWKSEQTDSLQLDYSGSVMIRGAGSGEQEPTNAPLARGIDITVGALSLADQNVLVAPLHSKLGRIRYHHGVIGATLFWNFLVEVDYDQTEIRFHEPDGFEPPSASRPVPLEINGYPFVNVRVATATGDAQAHVVVDLGASHALQLKASTHPAIGVPRPALRTMIGRGVGGTMYGQVGRIAYVAVGDFVLDNVLVSFPDPADEGHSGSLGRHGNLGSGFLRRFHVLFDYRQRRLWLQPNLQFDQPFEYGMMGVELLDDDRGLFVDRILPDSPALEAGLRVGDVLMQMDDRPIADYSREELRRLFRRHGATLRVTVLRDGRSFEVELKLRRLI